MAYLLEHIFIHQGIPPDEVMSKTDGTRAFMFACAIRDIESGRTRLSCPLMNMK